MYQKVKSVERALKIMELLREKSIINEFVSPREAAKAAGMDTVMVANPGNTIPNVIPNDVWIHTWLQLLEI